jgi:outer membrane receptor for ferrienterochelin and colicins
MARWGSFVFRVVWMGALFWSGAASASAQAGGVTGTVTDSVGGGPIEGVEVSIVSESGRRVASVLTDAAGVYLASPLDPGGYTVRFTSSGWESAEAAARVDADVTIRLSVRLHPSFFRLPGVTTVARAFQALPDAAASATVMDREDLDRRPQLTVLEQIRTLPGLDIIRTGLVEGQMIPRGFSRLFNARVLLLTDGRIAQAPGPRGNLPSMIPATSLDMDRIELVRGPASALYGPDAAHGVLQIFTKSPFDDPGMSFALSGGGREQGPVEGYRASTAGLAQLEGRIAVVPSEHWAVKVSGRWFRGTEWRHQDSTEAANRVGAEACLADFSPSNPSCQSLGDPERLDPERLARIGHRDFSVENGTLDARVDWVPNERTELTASSGIGWTGSGIALLGGGATQVRESRMPYGQLRLRVGELSAQAYMTQAVLEDAYTLREGFGISDATSFVATQLQHRREVADWERLTYGVDTQFTLLDEDGLYGDRDIRVFGAFARSETDVASHWKLVAAARVDHHSVLPEAIVSPRLAMIFTPAPGHGVRATYNRAFTTPLPSFLFLDSEGPRIPLDGPFGYPVRSQGSAGKGFTFERIDGRPAMKSPLAPFVDRDPTAFLPSTTDELYAVAREYLRSIGSLAADVMDAAGSPTEAEVGVQLGMLGFDGVPGVFPGGFAAIRDIQPLREESTTTLELGYNGLLRERALLSIGAYYTKKVDHLGPFRLVTPHLYLDGDALVAFFVSRGVDEATASFVATRISDLPLGVVVPRGVSDPGPNALATSLNYGDIDLFGADVALELHLDRQWSTAWAVSWVSDDAFDADGLDVKLNASTLKWSGSVTYRGGQGLDVSAQYRFTKGYPVALLAFEGDVDDAGVFDLGVGYRLPWGMPLRVQIDVQNLFKQGYRNFVGAPELGRLTIVRAVWVLQGGQ